MVIIHAWQKDIPTYSWHPPPQVSGLRKAMDNSAQHTAKQTYTSFSSWTRQVRRKRGLDTWRSRAPTSWHVVTSIFSALFFSWGNRGGTNGRTKWINILPTSSRYRENIRNFHLSKLGSYMKLYTKYMRDSEFGCVEGQSNNSHYKNHPVMVWTGSHYNHHLKEEKT